MTSLCNHTKLLNWIARICIELSWISHNLCFLWIQFCSLLVMNNKFVAWLRIHFLYNNFHGSSFTSFVFKLCSLLYNKVKSAEGSFFICYVLLLGRVWAWHLIIDIHQSKIHSYRLLLRRFYPLGWSDPAWIWTPQPWDRQASTLP